VSARPLRNQFGVVCSAVNLHRAAARTLARGRRFSRAGAAFALRLEERLAVLHEELSSGSYRHGRYALFTVRDPKVRLIAAAGVRDRVVHHAVHDVIEPFFDRSFIFDSFACRRGKGTHRALDRAHHFLRGSAFVLHLDVRRFFPSIDHGVLKGLLARRVEDDRLLALLFGIVDSTRYLADLAVAGRAITRGVRAQGDLFGGEGEGVVVGFAGLPLGNLTSQLFANLVLDRLDQFVKHRLRVRRYVRYMDDLVLFGSSKAELRAAEVEVRAFCRERLLLELHECGGPAPVRRGVSFLGFRLLPTHRRLRPASVSRFVKRSRRQQEVFEALSDRVDEQRVYLEHVRRSTRSFNAHALHADSYGLRCALYARFPLIEQELLEARLR
jgi:RNA-directed DNA polymerase